MEKERVLINDTKGLFLKMFKRKFKHEFDFYENCYSSKIQTESDNFDRFIFVVYNKQELIEFLKLEKKGTNVLACLFDKQLFSSLCFLEEIKNLILLDSAKTRTEIIKELKSHFKITSGCKSTAIKENYLNSAIPETQFYNFYKALFFLT